MSTQTQRSFVSLLSETNFCNHFVYDDSANQDIYLKGVLCGGVFLYEYIGSEATVKKFSGIPETFRRCKRFITETFYMGCSTRWTPHAKVP